MGEITHLSTLILSLKSFSLSVKQKENVLTVNLLSSSSFLTLTYFDLTIHVFLNDVS